MKLKTAESAKKEPSSSSFLALLASCCFGTFSRSKTETDVADTPYFETEVSTKSETSVGNKGETKVKGEADRTSRQDLSKSKDHAVKKSEAQLKTDAAVIVQDVIKSATGLPESRDSDVKKTEAELKTDAAVIIQDVIKSATGLYESKDDEVIKSEAELKSNAAVIVEDVIKTVTVMYDSGDRERTRSETELRKAAEIIVQDAIKSAIGIYKRNNTKYDSKAGGDKHDRDGKRVVHTSSMSNKTRKANTLRVKFAVDHSPEELREHADDIVSQAISSAIDSHKRSAAEHKH